MPRLTQVTIGTLTPAEWGSRDQYRAMISRGGRVVCTLERGDLQGADETRLLMQNDGTGKPKNGFVWTVVAADEYRDQDVAYVFAGARSGETPKRLLCGTKCTLIVDC